MGAEPPSKRVEISKAGSTAECEEGRGRLTFTAVAVELEITEEVVNWFRVDIRLKISPHSARCGPKNLPSKTVEGKKGLVEYATFVDA